MQYISGITTLPNLFISFSFFLFTLKSKEHNWVLVNKLTKNLSSVYIVHQTPAFIPFLWMGVFNGSLWILNPTWYYIILVACFTILGCSFIDILRIKWIQPYFIDLSIVKKMISKVDGIYQKL